MSTPLNAIEMDAKMDSLIIRDGPIVVKLPGSSATYKRRLFREHVGRDYDWTTDCFNCMCNQVVSPLCDIGCHKCVNFYINGYNPYCHNCCVLYQLQCMKKH